MTEEEIKRAKFIFFETREERHNQRLNKFRNVKHHKGRLELYHKDKYLEGYNFRNMEDRRLKFKRLNLVIKAVKDKTEYYILLIPEIKKT